MRKFLLVIFIGMVLGIYLHGLINDIKSLHEVVTKDEIDKGYTTVYME